MLGATQIQSRGEHLDTCGALPSPCSRAPKGMEWLVAPQAAERNCEPGRDRESGAAQRAAPAIITTAVPRPQARSACAAELVREGSSGGAVPAADGPPPGSLPSVCLSRLGARGCPVAGARAPRRRRRRRRGRGGRARAPSLATLVPSPPPLLARPARTTKARTTARNIVIHQSAAAADSTRLECHLHGEGTGHFGNGVLSSSTGPANGEVLGFCMSFCSMGMCSAAASRLGWLGETQHLDRDRAACAVAVSRTAASPSSGRAQLVGDLAGSQVRIARACSALTSAATSTGSCPRRRCRASRTCATRSSSGGSVRDGAGRGVRGGPRRPSRRFFFRRAPQLARRDFVLAAGAAIGTRRGRRGISPRQARTGGRRTPPSDRRRHRRSRTCPSIRTCPHRPVKVRPRRRRARMRACRRLSCAGRAGRVGVRRVPARARSSGRRDPARRRVLPASILHREFYRVLATALVGRGFRRSCSRPTGR